MSVSKSQATYNFQHVADQYVYSQTFGPATPSDDKWESTKGDLAYMLDLTKPRTFKHPLLLLSDKLNADVFKYLKSYESSIVIIAPDSIDVEYYTSADAASDSWCELTGICERDESTEDDDEDDDDEYQFDDDPILDDDDDDNEDEDNDKNAKG